MEALLSAENEDLNVMCISFNSEGLYSNCPPVLTVTHLEYWTSVLGVHASTRNTVAVMMAAENSLIDGLRINIKFYNNGAHAHSPNDCIVAVSVQCVALH